MWILKVTFLLCDFYFQVHVFMSAVICMLCINHVARPLRLSAALCVVDFRLSWNPSPLSVTGNRFAALFRLVRSSVGIPDRGDVISVRGTKRRNDKVMTASVLCAAVLTLHHRYKIVCVVKCVSKIPQADESESCGLWREFQKLTPGRCDSNSKRADGRVFNAWMYLYIYVIYGGSICFQCYKNTVRRNRSA